MTAKVDPQMALEEIILENDELAEVLVSYFATRPTEEARQLAKAHADAGNKIREMVQLRDAPVRYRCGQYVIDVSPMEGGKPRRPGHRVAVHRDAE